MKRKAALIKHTFKPRETGKYIFITDHKHDL